MELIGIIIGVIILLSILSFDAYTIFINTRKNEGMIQAQIEAGKVTRSNHVTTLPYDASKKIISDLISMYTADALLVGGFKSKKPEEISLAMDDMTIDICMSVWEAMSNELKQSMLFYVTEKHLKIAIKDEVRLNLVARLSLR